MHEPRLELEGEEILFYDGLEGDSIDNSIAWIPSLKVVCATDVAFHDCHLWPIESNVERRKKWRKDIAGMMDLDPRIVIPGHCDAAKIKILEEVQEDTSRSYTDCVKWSIDYLDNYDEVYHSAKTGAEMVDRMFKLLPGRQGRGLRHPLAGAPAVPAQLARLADPAAGQARGDLPEPGGRLRRRPGQGGLTAPGDRRSGRWRPPPAAVGGSGAPRSDSGLAALHGGESTHSIASTHRAPGRHDSWTTRPQLR